MKCKGYEEEEKDFKKFLMKNQGSLRDGNTKKKGRRKGKESYQKCKKKKKKVKMVYIVATLCHLEQNTTFNISMLVDVFSFRILAKMTNTIQPSNMSVLSSVTFINLKQSHVLLLVECVIEHSLEHKCVLLLVECVIEHSLEHECVLLWTCTLPSLLYY